MILKYTIMLISEAQSIGIIIFFGLILIILFCYLCINKTYDFIIKRKSKALIEMNNLISRKL